MSTNNEINVIIHKLKNDKYIEIQKILQHLKVHETYLMTESHKEDENVCSPNKMFDDDMSFLSKEFNISENIPIKIKNYTRQSIQISNIKECELFQKENNDYDLNKKQIEQLDPVKKCIVCEDITKDSANSNHDDK